MLACQLKRVAIDCMPALSGLMKPYLKSLAYSLFFDLWTLPDGFNEIEANLHRPIIKPVDPRFATRRLE